MATPVRATPMPPAPLRALTSLAAALAAACALAQAPSSPPPADPPPTPLPAEYSDAARKAYVAGLKEARELIAQKRYEAAIERLDALSRDRPREPQARFLKAVAQTEAGKRDDALATLTALAADFPELPEVHDNLAGALRRQGQPRAREGGARARDRRVARLRTRRREPRRRLCAPRRAPVRARRRAREGQGALPRQAQARAATRSPSTDSIHASTLGATHDPTVPRFRPRRLGAERRPRPRPEGRARHDRGQDRASARRVRPRRRRSRTSSPT